MQKKFDEEILLTISVAAYNVEKFIKKTLESCIVPNEYIGKMEVIIVNDGSTDLTGEIAMSYQEKYPNLFNVINKKNGGYGSTINAALSIARGRYFKLLDGDDWFDKEELVKLLDKIENCQCDVLFMKYKRINCKNGKAEIVGYGDSEENLVHRNLSKKKNINWAMHGIAVKTELFLNNKVEITENCFYTDAEYVFYIMTYMNTYLCFDISLYQYRVGDNGQSVSIQGLIKHKEDAKRVLVKMLKIYEDIKDKNLRIEMEKYLANSARFMINGYILSGIKKENRNDVIELDAWLKESYYHIYKIMNKCKILHIFRKIHYHFYLLIWMNTWRKFR